MKKLFKRIESRSIIFWGNMVLLLLVMAVAAVSLLSTRRVLSDNAQMTGEKIAGSYWTEEERNFELYRELLLMGSQYVEEMAQKGADEPSVETWLKDYMAKLIEVIGMESVLTCRVSDGEGMIVCSGDYQGYEADRPIWYERALDAHGEIVYTDVYADDIYDRQVVTIAKECGDTGTVIAFDIALERFRVYDNSQSLPEGGAYFLYDSKGNLIYMQGGGEFEGTKSEDALRSLYLRIQDGEYVDGRYDHDTPDGSGMRVYYKGEANGFVSVILIPNAYLTENWEVVISRYLVVFLLILCIIILMWLRQKQIEGSKRRLDETVQILGNSYYAFYRINIEKETYEMIKEADYVKDVLPPKGRYEDLLDIFERLIKEESYEEFLESFSIRNVKKQIEKNVMDFGGDFQRIFENEWKWVSVHIFYAPSISKDEVVLCSRQVEEEKHRQLWRMILLKDSLKAAHASDESQKKFFSGISHDMRTPLNVIIGMSEMAENNLEDKERVRNYLKKIHYSSKQLLGLINRVLEMSRAGQGTYLKNEPFNLKERIARSVEAFEAQARKEHKDLHFAYHIEHEEVCGDAERLYQIVNNLMSNAVSFTKEGDSIEVTLKEMYNQKYTRYQLTVSDTGAGMSKKLKEQICQPDLQEASFDPQGMEELGMGLMIVKNVVSLMNGEIDVESELGEGTTVTVTLPFETTGVHEDEEGFRKSEAEAALEGRRILLAEDYELNMELATEILTMCKAEVVQAKNGKEALDIFAASDEFSIDAVLMDMQMPIMNGCESAEAIRSLDRADAKRIPIIAVTANTFAEDISRTARAGMNAHIAKPIDIRILCNTLMNLLDNEAE